MRSHFPSDAKLHDEPEYAVVVGQGTVLLRQRAAGVAWSAAARPSTFLNEPHTRERNGANL